VSAFGHADPSRYMSHTTEEYEDLLAEPGSRTSVLGPMPSFSARSVLSQPTIRSVGGTTATSDDTEVTRTTVTSGSEDATSMPMPWFQERMRAEI
jgi:predicted membrane-bound mannosyltransferase